MVSTRLPIVSVGQSPDSPVILPVDSVSQPALLDLVRAIVGPRHRIAPAWTMLAFCLVCAVGMLVAFALIVVREGFSTDILEFIAWGPLFLVNVVTGVLILDRYPGHRVGWVLCLAGTVWITAHVPYLYGLMGFVYPEWHVPAPEIGLQAGFHYPFGLYLLLVELPLVFPTGRLVHPSWVAARILGITGAAAAAWSIGFGAEYVAFGAFGAIPNPWYLTGSLTELTNRFNGFDLIYVAAVPAVISMFLRLRHADEVQRLQLRWIAWDSVIVLIGLTLHRGFHIRIVGDLLSEEWYWVYSVLWGLSLNSIAIVVGISILKLRLYNIDVVIHRSLLYAILIAVIAFVYVMLVNVIETSARNLDATGAGSWWVSFLVAAGVALLVHPLYSGLRVALNHWLFGRRDDPEEILTRLSLRLESAIAPGDVLHDVARSITGLLRLPHAAIALGGGPTLELAAESGVPGREQVGIPMVYQHERVGELRITPRTPGEGLSLADRRVLESIARQTAVAVYAVRISSDLRRAREHLVTTREEERQRLRRDLHDGLGAQLAALTIQAGSVQRNVRIDPGRAERDLGNLQHELQAAIADVRRLVHGLRPPALDEFGLVEALRSRMQAFEGVSGIEHARLEVIGQPRPLPAAFEVAVYRIVEEALTNSSRHGHARQLTIALEQGDAVRLVIEDDGVGIPASYQPGVGVHSMRERAEELGGTLRIGPGTTGGTRIEATIPLAKAEVTS